MSAIRDIAKSYSNEIYNYITKDLKEFYPKATAEITTPGIKKIKTEAETRINDIRSKRSKFPKIVSSNMVQNYVQQRDLFDYKNALLKGYAFVMKTREALTGETVSYLIMVDSFSDNPSVAKLSLEDILPGINLIAGSKGSFQLQLNQIDQITNIVRKKAAIPHSESFNQTMQNIIGTYSILRTQRKTKDGKKTAQGFILEQSIRETARDRAVEYITDTEAFYRGGDLKGGDVPEEIAAANENLEVKNIASKYRGASLTQEGPIEVALVGIKTVCEKYVNNPSHFKTIINDFIFKTDKNIGERKGYKNKTLDTIEKKVESALNNFINGIT